MSNKNKDKGKAYERRVAQFLTETYGKTFVRVPNSGAYIGGKNFSRASVLESGQVSSKKGDIHPPDNWLQWNCECKHYKNFDFHTLFTGKNRILDVWIDQTLEVASENDFNIIFIRVNYKGDWVVFEDKFEDNFDLDRKINYNGWVFTSWNDFWSKKRNIKSVEILSGGPSA